MKELFIARLKIQSRSFEVHEVGDLVNTGDTVSLRDNLVFYGEDNVGDKLFGIGILKKIIEKGNKPVIVFSHEEDVVLPNGFRYPPKK